MAVLISGSQRAQEGAQGRLSGLARTRWRSLLGGLAIAIALTGCGESKVAQCNKLIEVVNKGRTISQSVEGTDAETMKKLSSDLATLSQEIQAVEVADESLQGFQSRFVKIYQDLGQASASVATALEQLGTIEPNQQGLEAAQKLQADVENASKLGDQAAKDEEALVTEVNTYCSGES